MTDGYCVSRGTTFLTRTQFDRAEFAHANEPLAKQLARVMAAKGIADRVHAVHFHKWCRDQLVAFGQSLPDNNQSVKDKMASSCCTAPAPDCASPITSLV